jgi:hypothetical protein
MESSEIVNKLFLIFAGRDPLAEAHAAMQKMDHDELTKRVLIAANRIGLLIKGEDYDDTQDATVHLCHGIEVVFQAYNNAWIDNQATVCETGNA